MPPSDNHHLVEIEFEPEYGARFLSLKHPDEGCQPVSRCECGRDLSIALTQYQEESFTAEEIADWAGEKPLGTCFDCADLDRPPSGCWVQGWYDYQSADDTLAGKLQLEVRPVYEDESVVFELVRAQVPGQGTQPASRWSGEGPLPALHCPACGQATLWFTATPDGLSLLCRGSDCPQANALHMLLADEHTKDHLVEITESSFSVQHPIVERIHGALFNCALHAWLTAQSGPPGPPGRYWVSEKDGAALGEVHYDFEPVEERIVH